MADYGQAGGTIEAGIHRAYASHTCVECGQTIEAGEMYVRERRWRHYPRPGHKHNAHQHGVCFLRALEHRIMVDG